MCNHPTTDASIQVDALVKEFTVPVRSAGLRAALRSVVRRDTRVVTAVDDISFALPTGSFTAFLGSNGAGKTTTLKMLSGLLQPTAGRVRVAGSDPGRRERTLLAQLALVMGQRSQLIWDLPAVDSFDVQRAIYRIPHADYRRRVTQFVELLDIGDVVRKPVRNLSLGERMKCELAVALLHEPRVLFLDEPTIGLDTTMQRRIRDFLRSYNAQTGATVLLTSHYMADVEALCERVIAMDRGRIVFDGSLSHLAAEFATHKTLRVCFATTASPHALGDLAALVQVVERDATSVTLRVERGDVARVTADLLAACDVVDLAIEEPPIEELIDRLYTSGTPRPRAALPRR